ncbi:MAG: single-stranded DNA-binding protein [Candidatus Eisenbacteria bacterium]
MAGVNKVMLIGNLGKDPEVRSTTSGQRVANFSLATSRSWTGQDGQRQEKTEWHSIVVWGKLAEICEKYLQKGKQVYIEGRIETRSWQDKEGQTKYKTEIICEQMTMLGRAGGEKNGGEDKSVGESGYDAPRGSAPKDESYEPAGNVPDDDLPF